MKVRSSLVWSMLVCLLAVACSNQTAATSQYAPTLKVGLLITTGGIGGDLAGPTIGAASVAADHLKQDHNVSVTLEQADYQGDLTLVPRLLADLSKKVDVIIVGTDDPSVIPDLAAVSVPVIDAYLSSQQAGSAPNIFSLGPTDEDQARRLVSYLISIRKLGNIAVIFEDTAYGTRGADLVEQAVSERGGELVAKASFPSGGDVHTPAMLAADRDAQAVIVWTDNPAEAARITIDVHRDLLSYQLAFPASIAVPQFGKNAVAQVVPTAFREGILSVGPWVGPWTHDPQVRRFYKDFERKQSDLAPVRCAQVYDAVIMSDLAKAKGDISQGLAQLKDFRGASVPVTFDDHRQGIGLDNIWVWGFTKSKDGAGAEFFPAVDTGGGFFTLIGKGFRAPSGFEFLVP